VTALGEYPSPPQQQELPLPGGMRLTGMVELPQGVSDECRVTFNLMLQLGPLLASLECFIRLMRFIGWLLKFVKVVAPPDPIEIPKLLQELPPISADLMECVTAYLPQNICPPVKAMLLLIARYLECLLEVLDSIGRQQLEIGVKMGDAQGNPELQEALNLASQNVEAVAGQALASAGPALELLNTVNTLLTIVGAGAVAVPSLDQFTGGAVSDALQPLQDVVTTIKTVAEALPC
jgi:hypothetical protein